MKEPIVVINEETGEALVLLQPDDKQYLVTATMQILVDARDSWDARLKMKDAFDAALEKVQYPQDPSQGCIITEVYELPEGGDY